MSKVTAVFTVCEKTDPGDGSAELQFQPPYALPTKPGEEPDAGMGAGWKRVNLPWSKATPSGAIRMHITNPDAAALFERGETYLVTFEKFPG